MEDSPQQGKPEHHTDLCPDGAPDFLVAHPHLLHDFKVLLILEALRELLVVHDDQQADQEDEAEEDADEQQPAVHAPLVCHAGSVVAIPGEARYRVQMLAQGCGECVHIRVLPLGAEAIEVGVGLRTVYLKCRAYLFRLLLIGQHSKIGVAKGVVGRLPADAALIELLFHPVLQSLETDSIHGEIRAAAVDEGLIRSQCDRCPCHQLIFVLGHQQYDFHLRVHIARSVPEQEGISLFFGGQLDAVKEELLLQGHMVRLCQSLRVLLQGRGIRGGISEAGDLEHTPEIGAHDSIHIQVHHHSAHRRDDDHGGEHTDIGQAGGIFLHAVEHAGDGDEMLRTVVELLASLQEAQ